MNGQPVKLFNRHYTCIPRETPLTWRAADIWASCNLRKDTAGHAYQQIICIVKLRCCHAELELFWRRCSYRCIPTDAAYGLDSSVHTANSPIDVWYHGHSGIKVCPKIVHQLARVYSCISYPQGRLQLINWCLQVWQNKDDEVSF